MTKSSCLFPILILYFLTSSCGFMPCKLRVYLARAEQADENGLRCWDTVKVPACGGRCDSREELEYSTTPSPPTDVVLGDEGALNQRDGQQRSFCGTVVIPSTISDWEFPFKKSHHPVCVYGGRRPLIVRLRHCDHEVAAGTDLFHFVAAEDCRCKVCSSQYTSCEWLPPNSTLLDGIYDEFEDLDEE